MSISPPSDIVLDVARAADTSRAREATARLGAGAPVEGAFAATLSEAASAAGPADTTTQPDPSVPSGGTLSPDLPAPALPKAAANVAVSTAQAVTAKGPAQAAAPPPVYRDFEAMVLASLFQSAMPQDSGLFGSGTGGSVWSSVFVQEIGKAIAAKGGIGIAASLARDSRLNGSGSGGANASDHAAALALMTRLDLKSFGAGDTGSKLWE